MLHLIYNGRKLKQLFYTLGIFIESSGFKQLKTDSFYFFFILSKNIFFFIVRIFLNILTYF